MATRSKEAFIKGLQDGRTIYYKGERVADVTRHPVLKTATEHAALVDYTEAIGFDRQSAIDTLRRMSRDVVRGNIT